MSAPNIPLDTEIVIIGAGPIGLELAIALRRAELNYVHLEAGQIGETIFRWPPHTQFFSSPERIAIAGLPIHSVDQQKITGEAYLAYLRAVTEYFDLDVQTYEPVVRLQRAPGGGFLVESQTRAGPRHYRAQRVIFAAGGMAAPRYLGVPGEDLPHVHHVPSDPHRYFRTRLVIVGGRNTAVEAALRAWRAGADVAVAYRRAEFDPAIVERHLYAEVTGLIEVGKIAYYPETVVAEITPTEVVLASCAGAPGDAPLRVPADFVLLATGFTADMQLLEQAGVDLVGLERRPCYRPETMETNVPGLYVAGTAAAGTQQRFEVFIETSHIHVERITTHITGRPARLIPLADARRYAIAPSELES